LQAEVLRQALWCRCVPRCGTGNPYKDRSPESLQEADFPADHGCVSSLPQMPELLTMSEVSAKKHASSILAAEEIC
jgi:hypothetical protein